MNNVNMETSELFKRVDGPKVEKYFSERPNLAKSVVSKKALSNRNFISDAIRKGRARTALWNNVCDVLEVPRDYFDYVEPVKATESVPEKKAEIEDGDIKDVLISMLVTQKKQEALLIDLAESFKRAWG